VTDLLKALLREQLSNHVQTHAPYNNTVEVFCVRPWTIAMRHAHSDVTQQWEPKQTCDKYATLSEACFLCMVQGKGL
jgi:hypothetical protein